MLSNLLASGVLDLLAQTPAPPPSPIDGLDLPPLPTAPPSRLGVRDAVLPGAVAALIGSAALIILLSIIDYATSRFVVIDDILRTIIVVFGVIGPVTLLPLIGPLLGITSTLLGVFFGGTGWGFWIGVGVLSILVLAAVGFVVWSIYNGGDEGWRRFGFSSLKGLTWGRIFIYGVILAQFFALPWMQFFLVGVINWVSVPSYNGLLAVYRFLENNPIGFLPG